MINVIKELFKDYYKEQNTSYNKTCNKCKVEQKPVCIKCTKEICIQHDIYFQKGDSSLCLDCGQKTKGFLVFEE